MKKRLKNRNHLKTVGACCGVVVGSIGAVHADTMPTMEELQKENLEMHRRLDTLEALAQKEGLLPSGTAPKMVSALSDLSISGFVQASYFYNLNRPADNKSDGYLWNTTHNSFSINKIKLTLASPPVEHSGENWSAGYRFSMIWGEDSPVLNTGSPSPGFEALREAYVELNVPIGTGLDVKAGQLISLLNFESGDGGAANPNFSQGFQWFYTGNGPSAGVQLAYTFTDKVDAKVRVQNGLYGGPVDVNSAKTVMGSLDLKPDDKTWINLIGFGGDGVPVSKTLIGGSILAGRKFTDKIGTGFEFDYFHFDNKPAPNADLWSIGGWIWYDFTPKVGVAFRAEFLDDPDGFGIKGVGLPGASRAGSAILSPDANGNLSSFTVTLNLKPTPNIKIQPEVRYDHTSYTGGFDGKKDRVTIGAGVSYLF